MEKLCSRLIDGRALAAGLFLQFPDFSFSEYPTYPELALPDGFVLFLPKH